MEIERKKRMMEIEKKGGSREDRRMWIKSKHDKGRERIRWMKRKVKENNHRHKSASSIITVYNTTIILRKNTRAHCCLIDCISMCRITQ